jgi:hypothetical protein
MTLVARLASLAESGLLNPSIATEDDINAACEEAIRLIGSKSVNETTELDLAFYRLKNRLKIEIGEDVAFLYREALSAVKNAPYSDASSGSNILYKAV